MSPSAASGLETPAMTAHLYHNGTVRPLDPRLPDTADAVAVVGDTIVAVGDIDECRSALGRDVTMHDLTGAAMLPGFVDAHCHPMMLGQTRSWVDLSPAHAPDLAALVKRLDEAARRLPAGEPLRGYGYNHRVLPEHRHPTRADLDVLGNDREIYIMNQSGHGGVLNSFGLAAHGIDATTLDVPGGVIGRDAAGRPNGLVLDAACDLVTGEGGVKLGNHAPNFHLPATEAQEREWLAGAQQEFLAAGVTALVDAQVSRRELRGWIAAQRDGALKVRVGVRIVSAFLDELLELGWVGALGGDRLDLVGVKLYADGTLGGWSAWFPCGYHAEPHTHGVLFHDPAELADLVVRCHAAGLATGTHAQSPGAIELVVDAIEQAAQRTGRALPHTVEHCGLPSPTTVKRLAAAGVRPVFQPAHHASFGDGVVSAAGDELGGRYNPAGEFVSLGVLPALSSDAPVTPPNPLRAVASAVLRRSESGRLLGDAHLRLDVPTALRAHTLGSARVLGKADLLGTIAPGKRADFVVLDRDPTVTRAEEIEQIDVLATVIGAEVVHDRR